MYFLHTWHFDVHAVAYYNYGLMLALVASPNLAFRTIKSISKMEHTVVRRLAPRDDLHYIDAGALCIDFDISHGAPLKTLTETCKGESALEINVCYY
jgi:hypothetical protein